VKKIRILLVDDHTLFREGLRRLLDGEPGVEVCADFDSAESALLGLAKGLEFDVALLDYELTVSSGETTNGLDLLRQIRRLRSQARVLFVTAGMQMGDLTAAVRDLHAGIFLKTEPIGELMLAIQRTAKGERWVSSGVALTLLSNQEAKAAQRQQGQERLSARESTVLRGVLEGLSNMELTESSVKAVLQKLFEKAGVRSRSQLVRYAIETQIATK
jgi:DNA-binding NarL/FixJ family response regulator